MLTDAVGVQTACSDYREHMGHKKTKEQNKTNLCLQNKL